MKAACSREILAEAIKQALHKPYTVVELTAFLVGNSFQFSTLLHYMVTCYTWLTPGLYHLLHLYIICCMTVTTELLNFHAATNLQIDNNMKRS
jgi:diacylglycerol kinase